MGATEVAPVTQWMLQMDGGGSQGQPSVCIECQGEGDAISDGDIGRSSMGQGEATRLGASNIRTLASLSRLMDLLISPIASVVSVFLCPLCAQAHSRCCL